MSAVDCLRVDDRLIHGQVMVGWVLPLNIRRIILINDRIAGDLWQQDTLKMVVASFSGKVGLDILELGEAAEFIRRNQCREGRIIILESVADAEALYDNELTLPGLNLGCIHAQAGREKVLSFLYLDSGEIEAILRLSQKGIRVIARDLPGSRAVDVVKQIKNKRRQ